MSAIPEVIETIVAIVVGVPLCAVALGFILISFIVVLTPDIRDRDD